MFAFTETRLGRGHVIGQRNGASVHVWSDAEWQRAGSCCAHEGAEWRLKANLWLDTGNARRWKFLTQNSPDEYLHWTVRETELTSGWVNCDKGCVLPCLSSHRGKMILSPLGSGLRDLPRDNVYSSCKFNLCVFLFCGPYCRFSVETFLDSLMTGIVVYLGRKKVRWLNWHNQVKCITKNTQRYERNIQPADRKTTVCPKW